ncbi:hypothetical protein ACMHYO_14385 [Allopusillimonas ginsengisoli]|uniref:hypothetical protein n=1 Tax=Allopusillimonas ginsengisoli TaxID=453575 RepID=UPI0039C2DF1B
MTQASNLILFAQAVGVDISDLITSRGTLASLTTTDKTNLVNALNEVKASLSSAGATINDTTASASTVYSSNKTQAVANAAAAAIISDGTTGTGTTWSSTKLTAQISAAIAAIVDGAPEAFDTLKELADYAVSDGSAMTALTTAVNNRVRYDAAQSLSAPQQLQACNNIGIGDPATDFVAAYTIAKA